METQKVNELQDINSIGLQDEIPVLTDKIDNVVEKISYTNLLASSISSDENNIITVGDDGKLYASNDTDTSILEEKVETLESNVQTIQGNITTLTDRAYIKEFYNLETEGYMIWSNGYCEQWGEILRAPASCKIPFIKNFKDADYFAFAICRRTDKGTGTYYDTYILNKTESQLTIYNNQNSNVKSVMWKASGYLAEGEY